MKPVQSKLLAAVALGSLLLVSSSAGAQKVDNTPPALGAARPLPAAKMPGAPLPDDLSLPALADLIKGLSGPEGPVMRGAKEVAVFREAAPAVVFIRTKGGLGSGVVLPNGTVLTNRHVVQGIGEVQVFFKPKELAERKGSVDFRIGKVQHVDPSRDLATIKLDSLPPGFKSLKIATRDDIEVGADVYAIGHPAGYSWTFTQGVVSGIRPINREQERYTAIQTQTPINPGNSGGPLINADLEVVGINTWGHVNVREGEIDGKTVALVQHAQGLNFAVSARDIRAFLAEIDGGKRKNLALQVPAPAPGCRPQTVFSGRLKTDNGNVQTYSLRCDGKADAWMILPDDTSLPVQLHFDPDRAGKSSIVVYGTAAAQWSRSAWDLFRDGTFAVIGHHQDGKVTPTRFEFAKR